MIKKLLFFWLFVFVLTGAQAQQSNAAPKTKNPYTKVTLISLIPGAGQIYNKKYWKAPIVYAGFAVLTYSFVFYSNEYNEVRKSYQQALNKQTISSPYYANFPVEMLYATREDYRKSRDLSIIGMFGLYALQILDATVDAHLKGFDMNENLSLKIDPSFPLINGQASVGMNLTFQIK